MNALDNVTIKTKMRFIFGFFILLLVGLIVYASIALHSIQMGAEDVASNSQALLLAKQIKSDLDDIRTKQNKYVLTSDSDVMAKLSAEIKQSFVDIDEVEKKLADYNLGDEEKAMFAEINENLKAYAEVSEEIVKIGHDAGLNKPEEIALLKEVVGVIDQKATPIYSKINGIVEKFVEAKSKETREAKQAIAALIHQVILTLDIIGVITAVLVLGVVIGFEKTILSELLRITQNMNLLAAGRRDVEILGTQRKDEIGTMAKALDTFKNNAIEAERLKKEQAELERKAIAAQQKSMEEKAAADRRAMEEKVAADKRVESERKSTMVKLADDFESSVGGIVQGVASAATELQSNAESLTKIANNTNTQAASVASATEEASTSVQTVASAAEELTSSIGEISRQINESTNITRQAVEKSRETNETMNGLSVAAEKIGDVVKLIQSIAGQTNLLALNATIEAARAGDAGKGFAVVASEVKNLASQTEKATGEIAEQVNGIQTVSQSAVTAIQEISAIIERINNITSAVAAAVEEQSAATQEIARNTERASAGTREVSSSIARVSEGAQESGTASGELLSASSELSIQAEKLREKMYGFLASVRAA